MEEALQVAVEMAEEYLKQKEMQILIVVYNRRALDTAKNLYGGMVCQSAFESLITDDNLTDDNF